MKVRGKMGRLALHIGCVYMPIPVLDICLRKTYLVLGKEDR